MKKWRVKRHALSCSKSAVSELVRRLSTRTTGRFAATSGGRLMIVFLIATVFWLSGCASGPPGLERLPLGVGSSVGLRLDGQETPPALELSSHDPLHLGLTVNRGEGLRYQVVTEQGAGTSCRGRLQHGRVERCGPLPGGRYRVLVQATPIQSSSSGIWLWASAWNERPAQGILHLRKQFIVPAVVGASSMR